MARGVSPGHFLFLGKIKGNLAKLYFVISKGSCLEYLLKTIFDLKQHMTNKMVANHTSEVRSE